MTTNNNGGRLGRTAAKVAEVIRTNIAEGRIVGGQFLPSERDLAERHGVDKKTVRRALKALEADGLLEAIDRHGYRVTAGGSDPDRGCPIAYVPTHEPDVGRWHVPANLLLPALRTAGEKRGWSLLAVGSGGRTPADVMSQLKASRAAGIVLDHESEALVAAIKASGIPTCMIDSWLEDAGLDSIMQDGQHACMLAVRYLVKQGCRRIAWVGSDMDSTHALDRFSGTLAGLNEAGLSLRDGFNVKVTGNDTDFEKATRKLLSKNPRPDGIVAPWLAMSAAIALTAHDMGLVLGKDFHMVGWCPEEAYDIAYRPAFKGTPLPPAMTWSVRVMADTAMGRLLERRASPDLPAIRVKIPAKLMFDEGTA
jgi:DNA-binding LacI/PurR family transcriptional regulator